VSFDGQTLFNLLPALYRLRDAHLAQSQNLLTPAETAQLAALKALANPTVVQQQQLGQLLAKAVRGPVQSLLMLIAEQIAAVEQDLDQLYDDQFIETCAPWVISYIGDLIGYKSVKGVAPAVASPRAEVAHTISFRRRKGTVLVLEQLARDVTGWGAHAVEFFKVLGDTQYMNHIRPHNYYAPNLRRWEPRAYVDTGFDATAHTVDVRRVASERGRYNIQNIGIFLWSLNAYSLTMSPTSAVVGAPHCFRFSPLGRDMPLFTHPIPQGADITAAAEPRNVPDRLKRHVLCRDIEEIANGAAGVYYGIGKSLALYVDGLFKNKIQVCDLSGPDGGWANVPQAGTPYDAALDPHLGRIALPPVAGAVPKVQASFYYGFNADMGAGEYPRANSFADKPVSGSPSNSNLTNQTVVRVPGDYSTVQAALDALAGDGVVEITNSDRYQQTALTVNVSPNSRIELRAHDGFRPVLVLNGGEMTVTGGKDSAFNLNGLVITSNAAPANPTPATLIRVPANLSGGGANQLSNLDVKHCTLVLGWALTPSGASQFGGQPVLIAEPAGVQVTIGKSILGGVRTHEFATMSVADCIVDACGSSNVAYVALDGAGGGGALTLQGCTVVGKVHATMLSLVSNSIIWAQSPAGDAWAGALWADRKQEGCVRFSYIPPGSVIPRRFECVVEGYGTDFPGWAASTSFAVGQVIAATSSGATFLYRCTKGGATGAGAPSFPSSRGSTVTDGAVTWQNAGTAYITPGPLFESLRYGDPGYAKLVAQTDDNIRRGADDGGEMGAFHFVFAPQRETDLRVRLEEYIPVGLEFGIFYET
jgi:hypothetical protein